MGGVDGVKQRAVASRGRVGGEGGTRGQRLGVGRQMAVI